MKKISEPASIANFDSATAMLRALANYLRGEDFPLLGTMPRWMEPVMRLVGAAVNTLPRSLREQVYIWSGWNEAIPQKKLRTASAERVAEWMATLYLERKFPAV